MDIWRCARDSNTRFWKIVDDTEDEDFEIAIETQNLADLDDLLEAGGMHWGYGKLSWIFAALEGYLRDVQNVCPLQGTYLGGYLDAHHWAVSFYAAESFYEARGTRLPTWCLFAPGLRGDFENDPPDTLHGHLFGQLTISGGSGQWTPLDGALDRTRIVGAPLEVVRLSAGPQSASMDLTVTCQDGSSTKNITHAHEGTAQWSRSYVGVEVLTGAPTNGDPAILPVAHTAQFTVGDWVGVIDVSEGNDVVEVLKVSGITANTNIKTNRYLQPLAQGDKVIPMYTDVRPKQGGTFTGGGMFGIYGMPHRITFV
jgi:hypothetical protein